MPASPSSNGEPDPSLSAESKRIGDQYNSLESRLVWDWLCGGNRHFGYYPDPSTWWPFPLGVAHLRMQGKLLETLNLPPGARVLDVGCGDGHVAIDLARRGRFKITAFDVVERHVENARRNVQLAGLEQQVTVLQLDFDRLAEAIPDASHDGIYTSETLIHAADVPRVLAEFRRVLVPSGRVVLHEYHNDFIGARIGGFTAEIARMDPPPRAPPSSSPEADDERNESERENEMAPAAAFARAEAYFKSAMAKAGFEDVVVRNYSPNIEPMAKLLSVSAWWRYIVLFFHLQRIFPKTAARTEGYVGQEHWAYVSVSGTKPKAKVE
jgi:ubiquinone/menaquinone biosynthesis C-methylase UbiE